MYLILALAVERQERPKSLTAHYDYGGVRIVAVMVAQKSLFPGLLKSPGALRIFPRPGSTLTNFFYDFLNIFGMSSRGRRFVGVFLVQRTLRPR